jgi:hypothetical protein
VAELLIHVGDDVLAYDPAKLTNKDARELERFTGQRMSVFMDAELSVSDADHVTALVWLARRQNGESTLMPADVEFPFASTWVEEVPDPTDAAAPGAAVVPTVPLPTPKEAGKKTG